LQSIGIVPGTLSGLAETGAMLLFTPVLKALRARSACGGPISITGRSKTHPRPVERAFISRVGAGGGGLNPWCSGRAFSNLRNACRVQDAYVIQGPQTCDIASDETRKLFASVLVGSLCRELHFFAREMTSAQVLKEMLPPWIRLFVDHDTAFALQTEDILAIANVQKIPEGMYDLVVVREDNEQPADDSSGTRFPGIAVDPAYVATSFGHWVRIHLHAKSITTNRLHSGILGAICGKPVILGPSSSHKNKSVWQYSLASRGVRWVDSIKPLDSSWWRLLPARVRNSYKMRQLRLAFHGVPAR
jgi:hypothetical protein